MSVNSYTHEEPFPSQQQIGILSHVLHNVVCHRVKTKMSMAPKMVLSSLSFPVPQKAVKSCEEETTWGRGMVLNVHAHSTFTLRSVAGLTTKIPATSQVTSEVLIAGT